MVTKFDATACTTEQTASIFGVADSTPSGWRQRDIPEGAGVWYRVVKGRSREVIRWNVPALIRWKLARAAAAAGSADQSPDAELLNGVPASMREKYLAERTRKVAADAERQELAVDRERLRLQDVDDLVEAWGRAGDLLRRRLESIGGRFPGARDAIVTALKDTWAELGIDDA